MEVVPIGPCFWAVSSCLLKVEGNGLPIMLCIHDITKEIQHAVNGAAVFMVLNYFGFEMITYEREKPSVIRNSDAVFKTRRDRIRRARRTHRVDGKRSSETKKMDNRTALPGLNRRD